METCASERKTMLAFNRVLEDTALQLAWDKTDDCSGMFSIVSRCRHAAALLSAFAKMTVGQQARLG
eukprot:8126560-Pyramimonas_sp.AAC.1